MSAIFPRQASIYARNSHVMRIVGVVFASRRNFTRDVSPLTGENNKTRIVIIPPVPLQPLSRA